MPGCHADPTQEAGVPAEGDGIRQTTEHAQSSCAAQRHRGDPRREQSHFARECVCVCELF